MTIKKYPRDILWNELDSSRVPMTHPSFDTRRTDLPNAWRAKNIACYIPNVLDGRDKFTGIVLRSTASPYPYVASGPEKLYSEFTTVDVVALDPPGGDKIYWRYEVMLPAINGFLQAPDSVLSALRTHTDADVPDQKKWNQETINYYTTAIPAPGLWGDGDGLLAPGTFVDIIFENTKVGVIPRIIKTNRTTIQFSSFQSARGSFTHQPCAAPLGGGAGHAPEGRKGGKSITFSYDELEPLIPLFMPLLDAISRGESGGKANGSNRPRTYGAANRPAGHEDGSYKSVRLKEVLGKDPRKAKISEIKDKQKEKELLAAGRYQIIPKTLNSIVDQTSGISDSAKFGEKVQDVLGINLMFYARSRAGRYLRGEHDDAEGAGQSIAKEWAGMPTQYGEYNKSQTKAGNCKLGLWHSRGESFYQGIGPNQANISANAVLAALRKTKNNLIRSKAAQELFEPHKGK